MGLLEFVTFLGGAVMLLLSYLNKGLSVTKPYNAGLLASLNVLFIGGLFKILHFPGANFLLMVSMVLLLTTYIVYVVVLKKFYVSNLLKLGVIIILAIRVLIRIGVVSNTNQFFISLILLSMMGIIIILEIAQYLNKQKDEPV